MSLNAEIAQLRASQQSLQAALDRINDLPAALRQTVTDQQWAHIPLIVDEFATTSSGTNAGSQPVGIPLVVPRQVDGLVLIQYVVASVPAGATALVQLGSKVFPLPVAGAVRLEVQTLLGSGDQRSITLLGAAGPTSLWLGGQVLPTFGVLPK